MEKGVAVFDEKIEKRLPQILESNKAISGSGNFDRYVITYRRTGRNHYRHNIIESPKYRQTLRTNTQPDQTKRQRTEALGTSIDRTETDTTRLNEMSFSVMSAVIFASGSWSLRAISAAPSASSAAASTSTGSVGVWWSYCTANSPWSGTSERW